jgi:hypothetical protein
MSDPSQADRLVEGAADFDLFHDPNGTAYATIPLVGSKGTFPLKGRDVRAMLRHRFHEDKGKVPNGQALTDALGVLEGRALFRGPERRVWTRLARNEGRVYLDLGDPSWRVVEVMAEGWRVLEESPVPFRRPRGMLALPEPAHGGRIDLLRPLLNLPDDNAWRLVAGAILAYLLPEGPYPVLAIGGEQGAAKSNLARMVRNLVDPNAAPLRSEPRDGRDLMIAASNSWIAAFDNVSHLDGWLSDSLCRLSTGGGFSTRELYSDNEEIIFDAMRPVVLTGIEGALGRPDLLDRSIPLVLPAIPEDHRRLESEVVAEFERIRPAVLGAFLDAVAAVERNLPSVRLPSLPRLADFAARVTAAEVTMGWKPGAFLVSYTSNREEADSTALEGSPVATAVLSLAEAGLWGGTSGSLLALLNDRTPEAVRKSEAWPRTPRGLSAALRRIAPNLRRVGVVVVLNLRAGDRARSRLLEIRPVAQDSADDADGCPLSPSVGRGESKGEDEKKGENRPDSPEPYDPEDPCGFRALFEGIPALPGPSGPQSSEGAA